MPYDTIGPLVLWLLSTLGVGFCILKSSVYRTPIGYTALITSLCGVVSASLNFALYANFMRVIHLKSAVQFFPMMYNTLAFVPGLIVYWRISNQLSSKPGKCFFYFGLFLGFVFIVTGAVVNVIIGPGYSLESNGIYYFVNCGPLFVLVATVGPILLIAFSLPQQSLIAHSLLTLISEGVLLLLYLDPTIFSIIVGYFVSLVFVTFFMTLAVMLSILYGHHWTFGNLVVDKVEEDQSTDSLLLA